MKPNSYEIKVVKRCPKCDWRIFDKVTPTSGIIELKCPNCRKIVEIDLSYRTPIRRRATYYRASCHTYTYAEESPCAGVDHRKGICQGEKILYEAYRRGYRISPLKIVQILFVCHCNW